MLSIVKRWMIVSWIAVKLRDIRLIPRKILHGLLGSKTEQAVKHRTLFVILFAPCIHQTTQMPEFKPEND